MRPQHPPWARGLRVPLRADAIEPEVNRAELGVGALQLHYGRSLRTCVGDGVVTRFCWA